MAWVECVRSFVRLGHPTAELPVARRRARTRAWWQDFPARLQRALQAGCRLATPGVPSALDPFFTHEPVPRRRTVLDPAVPAIRVPCVVMHCVFAVHTC